MLLILFYGQKRDAWYYNFVAFFVVKIGKFDKNTRNLTSNLIISMNNDHRDLEFVCMNYVLIQITFFN